MKSTKEFRIQQKAEEDDASKAERERRRAEGYEEGETAQAAQLREARRAAAEARRLEFDEQRAKRVAEMEAEAEAEAMAVDELPVVKKRTPPKQPRHNTPNQPAGTKRFVFHEAAERQMVTMEGCGGSAFYSIQGKRKGPFSEVCYHLNVAVVSQLKEGEKGGRGGLLLCFTFLLYIIGTRRVFLPSSLDPLA